MSKNPPKNKQEKETYPGALLTDPVENPTEAISDTEIDEALPELPQTVPEEVLLGDVSEVPPLAHVIEAILFASQKAVTSKELVNHLKSAAVTEPNSAAVAFARIKESDIREALQTLQHEVAASGRAYQVRETATGWLLSSAAGFAPWLRVLYPEAKPTRLSPSALETLAIIAYRQPVTRADMEAVRGVSVDGVMQTLLDRGLVKISGRAELPGRPLLYATTQFFLDHFGLRNLDELPNAAELRHIPLPKGMPERGSNPVEDDSTPELPGVSEIITLRESVVFEEHVSDEATHDSRETTETGDSPEHTSAV